MSTLPADYVCVCMRVFAGDIFAQDSPCILIDAHHLYDRDIYIYIYIYIHTHTHAYMYVVYSDIYILLYLSPQKRRGTGCTPYRFPLHTCTICSLLARLRVCVCVTM